MTHAITLGTYLAAGFLVIGLAATALVPTTPLTGTAASQRATPGTARHRKS
jgi:hypothetical protein